MPFNHQGMRLIYANIPVIMSAFKISISTSKIIIFFMQDGNIRENNVNMQIKYG